MDRSHRLGKLNRGVAHMPPRHGRLFAASGALALLVFATLIFAGQAGNASASSGGIGIATNQPAAANNGGPVNGARFGARVLREGMTGQDVRVLKGIVRSKRMLRGVPLTQNFDRPTTTAVRRFQQSADMHHSGVVTQATARAMVRSLKTSVSTWYGPGFYGNKTACGQRLRPGTIGVAHKTLPCGSRVLIGHRGRYAIVPVIDRGPFGAGRTWDVTHRVAKSLGMIKVGVANVRHAVISRAK